MIEEKKMEVKRLRMLAEGFDRGSQPEYYDSLVQVRCPYTGVLDPIQTMTTHSDSPGSADDASTLAAADERDWTSHAQVDAKQKATHFPFSWNRLRLAVAGFAASVCAGFVLVAITATGGDPLPLTIHRPDSAVKAQNHPSMAPVKKPDRTDAVLPTTITQTRSVTPERKSVPAPAPAAPAGEETKTAVAPVSAPPTPEATGANSTSYNDLLTAAKNNKQNKKRVALLREVIELFPQGDEAMARLSIILMENPNNRQEALDLANRAATLNGDNAMAWLAIGYINQMKGSIKEAKKAYEKCAAAPGPQKFVRDCRSLI